MSRLELEHLQKELPRLGFITTGMGNYSEVWMWRQLNRYQPVSPCKLVDFGI